MNVDYKQWKKILSRRDVIAAVGGLSFILAWIAGCLLSHLLWFLISQLKAGWQAMGQTATTAAPGIGSVFRISHWFWPDTGHYMWLVMLVPLIIWLAKMPKTMYEMRIAYQDLNKGSMGTAAFTTLPELAMESVAVPLDRTIYKGHSGVPQVHITKEVASNLTLTVMPSRPMPGVLPQGATHGSFDGVAARKAKRNQKFSQGHFPHDGYDLIDTNKTNAAVVAGTQSGKTQTFTYPVLDLIMRAEIKDSVIITDLKGDMVKNTKAAFEAHGYDVELFNLVTPEYSIGYNPLALIWQAYDAGDFDEAQLLCNTFSYSLFHNENAKDPMWEESSIALVNALILAVCKVCKENHTPQRVTMYTVAVMLNELGSNPDEKGDTAMDQFFSSLDANDPAKLQYGTITFSQGITRAGIYTGTMAKLKNYAFSSIGRLTAENDLDLDSISRKDGKPVALFIVYPDYDDSNYSLIATLISQISYVLSKKATMSANSSLDRRVKFVLEEVANIPTIEGLTRYMNVGLQRGLIYYLVFQSIAQLQGKYGREGAEGLLSACGNKYDILADGKDDSEYFSRLLGKKTIVAPTRHGDPMSLDKSYGESEQARDLMTAEELSQLREGEWVLIRGKQRHALDETVKTKAKPIYANIDDHDQMLFQYQYLHDFDNPQTFEALSGNQKAHHASIDLASLVISQNEFSIIASKQPQEFDVHTADNQYSHVSITPDGKTQTTLVATASATPGKTPYQATPADTSDGLGDQHADDPIMTASIQDVVTDDQRTFSQVFAGRENQQNYINDLVRANLSSDEAAHFWRLETFGQMQAYLLEHRDDKATLYQRLRGLFELTDYEKKEGSNG